MRVWQPRVKREHGQLDGKGDEDQAEDRPERQQRLSNVAPLQGDHVERGHRLRAKAHDEEARQHEGGSGDGVQNELRRGVLLAPATPHRDEHKHGQQFDFPEHKEHQQVERREHAEHAGLEREQPEEILLRAHLDAERDQGRDDEQEGGEHHHRQAKAVDAHVELHVEAGGASIDPRALRLKLERVDLELSGIAIERDRESDRRSER